MLFVILGFSGKTVYRDFITLNNINDYDIAGFLPSFFYVAGFSLLLLIKDTRYPALIISIVTIASILFELKQFVSTGVFDMKDSIASFAGGLIAFIAVKVIEKKNF